MNNDDILTIWSWKVYIGLTWKGFTQAIIFNFTKIYNEFQNSYDEWKIDQDSRRSSSLVKFLKNYHEQHSLWKLSKFQKKIYHPLIE